MFRFLLVPVGKDKVQHGRKRSLMVRLFTTLLGGGVLLAALFIALCVWDVYRGQDAWDSFRSRMAVTEFPVDRELLFPPLPPDEQNFAGTPFLRGLIDPPETELSSVDIVSSLSSQHIPYIPGGLPERSWRSGYAWTPADVRLILVVREVGGGESAVSAAGNLELFRHFEPQFAELKKALDRPFCQFPLRFEFGPQYPCLHLSVLHELSLLLDARAVTLLHLGRTEEAMEDLLFSWNLIHKLATDKTVLSALVGESCFLYSLQPLWQGIAAHQWAPEQLEKMRLELGRFDFIRTFKKSYLFEVSWIAALSPTIEMVWTTDFVSSIGRAIQKGGMDGYRDKLLALLARFSSRIPTGWLQLNLINLSETAGAYAEAVYQVDKHLIEPTSVKREMLEFDIRYEDALNPDRFVVSQFKTSLFDNYIPRTAAIGQSFADMASIACGAELEYLAKGKYPHQLADIQPSEVAPDSTGINEFPNDVVGTGPYTYSVNAGSFTIYSLAWDGLNNFGQIGETASGMEDWVWPASNHIGQ